MTNNSSIFGETSSKNGNRKMSDQVVGKSQRGKLKKLRKRASMSSGAGGGPGRISGIISFDEVDELRELISQYEKVSHSNTSASTSSPIAPSILLAKEHANGWNYTESDSWKWTEGINHRDLIQAILLQNGISGCGGGSTKKKGKKRRRNEEDSNGIKAAPKAGFVENGETSNNNNNSKYVSPSIPSWARVHNPACAESIAVVEFCIENYVQNKSGQGQLNMKSSQGDEKESSQSFRIMPSCRIDEEMGGTVSESFEHRKEVYEPSILKRLVSENGYNARRALPLKTRLFQGDRPRHVTDVMMYLDKPEVEKKNVESCFAGLSALGKSETNNHFNKEKSEGDIHVNEAKIISCLLEPLILKKHEMKREGYENIDCNDPGVDGKELEMTFPTETTSRIYEVSEQLTGKGKLDTLPFTLPDAIEMVKSCAVKVESTGLEKLSVNGEDTLQNVEDIHVATFLSRNQKVDPYPRVFAIDCEMVRTSGGPELARISVIRLDITKEEPEKYTVMLDSLVKPRRQVLDYLTHFSGITAKMLEKVSTRIEEVQMAILAMICKEDIIVGHSLENDLRALRLIHNKVIDTSVLFRGDDNRKHSLRHLSACLLKKQIQTGCGTSGHCSEEDAAASLLLALRRARLGPTYKLYGKRQGRKNILQQVTEIRREYGGRQPLFLSRNSGPLVCIGPSEWIKEHVNDQNGAHALSCDNIHSSSVNALSSWLRLGQRRASLLWSKLYVDSLDVDASNKRVDEIITKVLKEVPATTLVLFVFQRGFHEAKRLSKQRTAAKDPRSASGWSTRQEEDWIQTMDIARFCEVLWIGAK